MPKDPTAAFLKAFKKSFQPPAPAFRAGGNWLVSGVWSGYMKSWLRQTYPKQQFEYPHTNRRRLDAALWAESTDRRMDIALEWEWDHKKVYSEFSTGDLKKVLEIDAASGMAIVHTRADSRAGSSRGPEQAAKAIAQIQQEYLKTKIDDRPVGLIEIRRICQDRSCVEFQWNFYNLNQGTSIAGERWVYENGAGHKEDRLELKTPRTKDFKLGQIHGTAKARKSGSEVGQQRHLFHSQVLEIVRSKKGLDNSKVRLIAYEMPLGVYRDWCVDLVGYDQNHDLYLIELKKGKSKELVSEAVAQINRYAEIVNRTEVKQGIESEFIKAYHFPKGFEFRKVRKAILSETKYYQNNIKDYSPATEDAPELLFFRSTRVIKNGPCEGIKLHLWKK